MPIIQVEIVGKLRGKAGTNPAGKIADAAGEVFRTAPGGTWVRLRFIPFKDYAENGVPPGDIRPVFVTVLKVKAAAAQELRKEAKALAEAVGKACGRPPGNVHIIYEPPATGRIAFGGVLLKK